MSCLDLERCSEGRVSAYGIHLCLGIKCYLQNKRKYLRLQKLTSVKLLQIIISIIVRCLRYCQEPNWVKPRGVLQRNRALTWLRENLSADSDRGVIYFADDDNAYSLEIFNQVHWAILPPACCRVLLPYINYFFHLLYIHESKLLANVTQPNIYLNIKKNPHPKYMY